MIVKIPTKLYKAATLTKEWLLDFGFKERPTDSDYIHYSKEGIRLLIEKSTGYFMCRNADINIENVHQLQNLFFALSGKELKLKK